ncbi:MAG: Cytidylate kinase [Promethearchaeota archaeon]|nr:MAG: Cytidylate kinase [Candidatus Lokiarchaeota archaeon]
MLITISGLHGTGKSTVGRILAEKLNLDYYSTGNAFRSLAEEYTMSLEEFSKYVETHPHIDKKLDQKIVEMASQNDDLVVESLLSGYLLKNKADYTILLKAPLKTRLQRMMERDETNYQEKLEETKIREESEIARFKELYNINIIDKSLQKNTFNIIINTKNLSIEEVVTKILEIVEKKKSDTT